MTLSFAVTVIALMLIANYWMFRSVLYPPFLFCAMWLLDLSVYRAGFVVIDSLHSNTLWLITGGALLFSIGGLLVKLLPGYLVETRVTLAPLAVRSRVPKYVILALFAASVPFIVHDRLVKASEGSGSSFIERSRNAAIEETENGGSATDYVVNSIAPLAILVVLLFSFEEHDWTYKFSFGFAVFANLIGGGRAGLLSLILGVTCIHLMRQYEESLFSALRIARWPLVLFAGLYVGLIFVSKDTSSYEGLGGLLTFFLVGYLIGPTAALDHVVQRPSDFQVANHTFQFLLKPAAALHLLPYSPPPVFDKFILVPFPTNVYTVYRFYLTEFGIWGCLLCIFVIGALHSLLYRWARLQGRLSLILFSLSLFPVVMVVFDDLYYVVGFYLRVIVLCLAYWALAGIDWRVLPAQSPESTGAAS
jgi:oligosaccharide repeat unit polymerase